MSTTVIIGIIVAFLLIAVGFSGFIQYREQIKAARQQNLSKYRYRAREGQDIYDKFFDLPIGGATRKVILQYIGLNLAKAIEVDSSIRELHDSLSMIKQKVDSPEAPADKSRLKPPSDPQELVVLMGRIKNLMRYVHRLGRIPGIDISAASTGLNNLKKLYLTLQTHTYVAIGKKKMSEKAFPQAIVALDNAKKLLLRQNIGDEETQAQLTELDQLIQEIKQVRAGQTDPQQPEIEDDENTQDLGDSDDLFQPKKKW